MNLDQIHSIVNPSSSSSSSTPSNCSASSSSSSSTSSISNFEIDSITSNPSSNSNSIPASNLSILHPSHSLTNLTISSPSSSLQTCLSNSNSLIQPTDHSSLSIIQNTSHLPSRPIPPPLTLLSSLPQSQDSSVNHPDDLMTARCSQFPIDSLEPRLSTTTTTTTTIPPSRFQHYLPTLSTDSSHWSPDTKNPTHPNQSLYLSSQHSPSQFNSTLDSSSLSSNDLRSSCSSLASSTKSSQSSSYFPSSNLPFQDSASNSAAPSASDVLFPPLAPPGYSQNAVYPAYTGPTSGTSLGLAYPATAFTPSGGSPPIASASSAYFHLDSAGAGRRHTVSAFASPMPIELGLVNNPEFDENMVREEKRRRNKESSQRFRDRTRERQREKQERLEYLERRTKELENQLKAKSRGDDMQGDSKSIDSSAYNADFEAKEKLWSENETLKSLLKKAIEEINRLEQITGTQSPYSPFNVGQFYNTLSQLSPTASTDLTHGSQSPSPVQEQSYFAMISRDASPASEKAPSSQRLTQPPITRTSSITYSPARGCTQLEQVSFHHNHQTTSNTSNEFWDCSKESGNLAAGWQAIDRQPTQNH